MLCSAPLPHAPSFGTVMRGALLFRDRDRTTIPFAIAGLQRIARAEQAPWHIENRAADICPLSLLPSITCA
jgi:hypothetical protein